MITRLHRTGTILAVFATLLVVSTHAGPAHASAQTVYVDGAAHCASLTPCYTKVQDGVNHAAGPGSASVLVFPGTYDESVDLDRMASQAGNIPGALALQSVDIQGNPAPGVVIHGATPIIGANFQNDVTLDGFVLEATQGDGALISTKGSITVASSTAANPGNGSGGDGDDGFDLHTTHGGMVTVHDSEATGAHGQLGDGFQIVSSGGVTMQNINASSNIGTQDNVGINIMDSTGDVHLNAVTANNNSEQGIYVYTAGNITLVNSTANFNTGFIGAQLTADLPVQTAADPAGAATSNITVSGLQAEQNAADGLAAQAFRGNVSVDTSIASDNQGAGMTLLSGGGNVTVTNSRSEANIDRGVYIEATDAVTFDRDGVINNGSNQTKDGGVKVTDGGSGSVGPVTIHDSLIQDNRGQGIDLFNLDGSAVHSISSNVICGNSVGGLRNNGSQITVPAQGDWWGDPSGPSSPQNPGGTGDKVGGDGTIDFDHWINSIEMTELASPAAAVGKAETLAFVFSDTQRINQLQNGPGDDITGAPFGVTTDNGALSFGSQVGHTVSGSITDTQMRVGFVPDHTGDANITLDGPCGLTLQRTISAESGGPWGDVDCSGSVAAPDLLRTLRFRSGAHLDAINSCGDAAALFDIDCSGTVDGRDALLLALFIADVPPTFSVPAGCPAVGS